ncbi:hypothetical protein [Tessaracoccus sp. OH4464_COT-324]|uniref:hypothetical protein n=1 Tax=Tessaracoccus sp. OH4464_COT-324 TaxID=2491059 RepID=UPI000F637524|nr:hypothetical protein [Tessaracoccus sp. OH4464_COT-324]RRD46897.1 hypothetical protein EII42_05570 [Tessaracoccus sp. OH4464_COT-324]
MLAPPGGAWRPAPTPDYTPPAAAGGPGGLPSRAGGGPVASGGGGASGAADGGVGGDGVSFEVDPDKLLEMSREWAATSDSAQRSRSTMPSPTDFGLMQPIVGFFEAVSASAAGGSRGASSEFDGIRGTLQSSAQSYLDNESNAASSANEIGEK